MRRIHVIDSHTGGEPTRIIVQGGPDPGPGDLAQRREVFRQQFDHVRRSVICEPRGSDILVGGLLCPPLDPACTAGVIFFNNTGFLNMCGHGMIGLMVTLAWLGRIGPGVHHIETPVGIVTAALLDSHRVAVRNVPSWRYLRDVTVPVSGYGVVRGDVAWGGNWFFIVSEHEQELSLSRWKTLSEFTGSVRQALEAAGLTGADGSPIDHIELSGPPVDSRADSRNFVLCPGGAYDRSPCGTGTSARIACLAADGLLSPGQIWRQESITGSVFEATAERTDNVNGHPAVVPTITGSAWITGDLQLIFEPSDPYQA